MDIKKTDYYKKWLKDPWTYVAGAVLLGVLNVAHMAATGGKAWGVSGALANWGAWVYQLFGGHPENWDYFIFTSTQNFFTYAGIIFFINIASL